RNLPPCSETVKEKRFIRPSVREEQGFDIHWMVPISIEWQRVLATTFARVRIAGHPSNSRISVAPVSRVQLDWWEEATEMFRRVLLVLHLWAALLASVSSCSWERQEASWSMKRKSIMC